MQNFEDKIAVVTGAASGIGFELSKLFAEQQMKVVLADIEHDELTKAVEKIRASGGEAIGVPTDVGNPGQVDALAKEAIDTFGAIHIACNNAGVYSGGHVWESTIDDFEWLIRVNQWGVINGIRSFIPQMIKQGDPCHLVNVASMAALTAMPYAGIYHMTKHAVIALSECLYHELTLSATQIKVSCVCPELFDTAIAQSHRNRPDQLGNFNASDIRDMAQDAITTATQNSTHPRILAERILQAIKDEQFYVLPDPSDPWRKTAEVRLQDIHESRNPTFAPPDI